MLCDFFATYIRSDIMRAPIPVSSHDRSRNFEIMKGKIGLQNQNIRTVSEDLRAASCLSMRETTIYTKVLMNKLSAVVFVFSLSMGSLSAKEEVLDHSSDLSSLSSPRHHYQLVPSEGRASYKWVTEHERNKSFKLKHTHISLPSESDFSQDLSFIHTQGDLGSCTAQTVTLSLEYFFNKLGSPTEFSPLYVYYNERKLNGTIDEDCGASLSDAIQAIHQYKACREASWTYSDDDIKFKAKPPKEAYQEARILFKDKRLEHSNIPNKVKIIKQILAQKIPIVCGINVFPSFEYDEAEKTGIVAMPDACEYPIGAHAITLVGYNDATQQFKFANSWGPSWGDKGFGYLPYNYILNKNSDNDLLHTYPRELWSISLSSAI